MKIIKLDHDGAQAVLQGHRRSTWRINDDKNLSVNDEVELIDKADPQDPTSWRAIGVARIDSVVEKRLGEIVEEDWSGHETYQSIEHMYDVYRKHYGDSIGPASAVKIVNFSFNPYSKPRKLESPHLRGTTQLTDVKLYADGGSRGNPGPSASGYVIMDMANNVIQEGNMYLGVTTNNQAEYQALKIGLEKAKEMNARNVYVYMDSLLVINQIKGIFKIKNRELWAIHNAIKNMLPSFKHVNFMHIPREMNKLADREVNQVLDAEAKQQREEKTAR